MEHVGALRGGGDPARLDALAVRLTGYSAEALDLASQVRGAPPGSDWTGPGAEAARGAARRDAADLGRVAEDLGAAAGLLRGHAEQVREALSLLRRAAGAAAEVVEAVEAVDPRRGLGL